MPPRAYAGTMTRSDLDSILLGHNEFFDSVVNFIPASLYVRGNEPDRDHHNHPNARYQKGTSKESKEARRARIKAAKAERYAGVDGGGGGGAGGESTVQAKARIERESRRKSDEEGSMAEDGEGPGALDDGGEGNGEADDAAVASYREAVKNGGGARPSAPPSAPSPSSSSRIEALRAKLRAKIEEKRRQSGIPVDADGEDGSRTVSKRAARRAEKRRRVEAAKAARKRKKGADASAGGRSSSVSAAASVAVSHRTIVLNDEGDDSTAGKRRGDGGPTSVGPGEDLANIDYGNVAGLNRTPHHLDNRSLASSGGKKKSLDRLLEEAEKKKRRLEELRASEDGADRDKAARIQWGDALREAGGERVRDDPAMIKKAMKRKAKRKAKSAAAWKARTDQRDASMKERQAIRRHNLQKRKQGGEAGANLSRKKIVEEADAGGGGGGGTANKHKRRRMGPHSGQGRAGFEGRKQGFINGGGPKADGGKKAAVGGGKTKGQ